MAERIKEPVWLEQEPKQQTIFDHYSIENEAGFLRRAEALSIAEKNFYIRENILGFLGEYVGEIPYKKISYVLKNGKITYVGLDVMDTYWQTAHLAGFGSREWFETVGMDTVARGLAAGQVDDCLINQATIVSPPKDADYGFVFHFVKGGFNPDLQGDLICEYILRYGEKRGQIGESVRITSELGLEDLKGQLRSAEDFLQNPLFSFSADSLSELDRILKVMGFGKEALENSERFERAIIEDRRIAIWIEQYSKGVIQLAGLDHNTEGYAILKNELVLLLAGIYNRAQDIKEQLDNITSLRSYAPSAIFTDVRVNPQFIDSLDELQFYATRRRLFVSGGSCPTTKAKDGMDFLSVWDIRKALEKGLTMQDLLEFHIRTNSEDTCSTCGEETKDRHYHCPNCQKKYADETSISSEQRTKKCKCGFTFGC